jgi:hypothetical protein
VFDFADVSVTQCREVGDRYRCAIEQHGYDTPQNRTVRAIPSARDVADGFLNAHGHDCISIFLPDWV